MEDGLAVPVVKFADELFTAIGVMRDYAGRVEKRNTLAEMDGSTFTISNLGMFV